MKRHALAAPVLALLAGARTADGPGGAMIERRFYAGTGRVLIRVAGRSADIAIDRSRNRIAVPYLALDRVDLWEIPGP